MKQTLNLEQKALKFKDFEVLSEQELRETEGGLLAEILIRNSNRCNSRNNE